MESESHYLPGNLKHLRLLRKVSQDQIAFSLGVKRSTYSGWQNEASEPRCAHLLAIGIYHRLSLDILLGKDLRTMRPSEIEQLQRAY